MPSDSPGGADQAPGSGANSFRRALLAILSLALFAAIVWFGGIDSWRTMLAGDPWMYAGAFILSGVVPGLSAWRLQTLVGAATGRQVAGWRRFFHINMTAIALGILLPRNAALVGGKAAYLRALDVPFLRGTWAVLAENVIDLVFLLGLLVPCLLVLVSDAGISQFGALSAAAFAVLFGFVLWMRGRDWRAFVGALVRRVPIVHRRIPVLEGGVVPGPLRALPLLLTTVVIHALMAWRVFLIAGAIGIEGSWLLFVAAYPLAQLSLVLAVAPGGLGTLDASWLGLLILGGLSNQDALAFTVAQRACIVVFPLVWYFVSFLMTLSNSADRREARVRRSIAGAEEGR